MSQHNPESATAVEAAAMKRALELAKNGPLTGANPRVGCVLLDSHGATISEGWHLGPGTPHAEVAALEAARTSGIDTQGLTAVVTLEPCSHTGKTGPCVEALMEAGITRVVYSVMDPGSHSSGGAQKLASSGVSVVHGVMEDAGMALIERWFVSTKRQSPWVTLKWAMSWDGRAAAADGTSQWITGKGVRAMVHQARTDHDVIVAGTNTVLVDDPSLTARTPDGGLYDDQPLAVVVGAREVPSDARVRLHPGGFAQHHSHDLGSLVGDLFRDGKRSVYVEGGPTLASAFLREGLVDEIHITVGPVLLGGPMTAVTDLGVSTMAEGIALDIREVTRFDDDVVVIARLSGRGL
jgi:diaminohydroxyphosphoribosylaminopyrimidine deaminase/5-amino-6-(5-phosphoribosylamino)uracil reductase